MQIVPQIVSTVSASMTVKHSKIGYLFPFGAVFGLWDVQNDSHTVFVVVPDWALVGGCSVGLDIAVRFDAVLGRLKVGDGQEDFGERRISVFDHFDIPDSQVFVFGVQINLLPDNLVGLSDWRFGFGPWLVLVAVPLLWRILGHLDYELNTSTLLLEEV